MRNRFYTHPTDDIIVEVEHMFNVCNGIVNVGVEDLHQVISGSENTIILVGIGMGSNRISNAIEDAIMHTCSVASDYNLFSAEKVILKLIYPQNNPLMIVETDSITQFAEMFPSSTSFIWGISENNSENSEVQALIIASNVQKK
jgi:cell division GTPase FtsZ